MIRVVPGTERFVVGRDDGLVLVDLSDPHGVDEIPVRDRIETAAPVLQVRLGAEEGTALAVLADGSTRAVSLDFGSPPARPATPDPALAAQRTLEPKGLADPPVEPQPEPAATPASPTPAVPEDRAAPEPVPAPSRTTPRSIPDAPETATPEAAPEAAGGPQGTPEPGLPPEPPPVPDEGGSTWGSLTGARRDAIAWVVLYGPDNVLNEALRVRPGTNGLWKAEGLAPGRYRVVLDAGPDRIAVVRPAFQVLTVRENEVTRAESFEVSGVR